MKRNLTRSLFAVSVGLTLLATAYAPAARSQSSAGTYTFIDLGTEANLGAFPCGITDAGRVGGSAKTSVSRFGASNFQAFREERPAEPRRGKSWLAVHRRDYGVYRMPLSQEAFTFLGFLVSGETIGGAIMKFARRFRRMPEQQDLFNWFRDWSEAGLFAAIAITEQEK